MDFLLALLPPLRTRFDGYGPREATVEEYGMERVFALPGDSRR